MMQIDKGCKRLYACTCSKMFVYVFAIRKKAIDFF